MSFDISDTLAANSDQLDAVDLLNGPMTFTITDVTRGKEDQPVNIKLAEFPRVWRPGKSMRRVLAACWGTDASVWVGRRVTLYCDQSVRFGNDVVGGTRIAALSHIDRAKSIPLLVSRGKSASFTVKPMADPPPAVEYRTDDQSEKIFATAREAGISNEELKGFMTSTLRRNVESSKTLTKAEAATLIDALEQAVHVDTDTGEVLEPELEPDGGWDDVTVAPVKA